VAECPEAHEIGRGIPVHDAGRAVCTAWGMRIAPALLITVALACLPLHVAAEPRARSTNYADIDTPHALMISGLTIGAVSALALAAMGLVAYVESTPICTRYSGPGYLATAHCLETSGPRSPDLPAELTWTFVGTLAAGALLAIVGLALDAGSPTAGHARLLLDVGPTGGTVGLRVAM